MNKILRAGVLVILLSITFLVGLAAAQEKPAFTRSAIVLPLQTAKDAPADKAALGVAVQNVVENTLALHSGLDESWMLWHAGKLFPTEADWQAFLRGEAPVPDAIGETKLQYVVTGLVSLKGDTVTAQLALTDRAANKRIDKAIIVDFPALEAFRKGLLDLLAEAGIAVPESQRARMLWKDNISLPAFALAGQGLQDYFTAILYHKTPDRFHAQAYEDGLKLAPDSYMLSNLLGWVRTQQEKLAEARTQFERAVALNPTGVDSLDGMVYCATKAEDDATAAAWLRKKTEAQGRDPKPVVAWFWNQRGDAAYDKKAYDKAIALYRKAMESEPRNIMTMNNLGLALWKAEQFEESARLFDTALKGTTGADERKMLLAAIADVHFNWGRSLNGKKSYEEAIVHFQAALDIDREARPADARFELDWMGGAYRQLHQNEKAVACYQQALAIHRALKDRKREADMLDKLGVAHRSLSRTDEALNNYEQALAIHRETKNRADESGTLHAMGMTLEAAGRHEQAAATLTAALEIRRELKDLAAQANTLDWLGTATLSLKQYDKALATYEQLLAARRELKDSIGESNALYDIGQCYRYLLKFEKAIEYYQQSLALSREHKNRMAEAARLTDIGFAYGELKRYQEAIPYYEQALAIGRTLEDRRVTRTPLNNLGLAYEAVNRYDKAIACYQEMLAVARATKDRRIEAQALFLLGMAYQETIVTDKALDSLTQALTIWREIKDRAKEAQTLGYIGRAHKLLGQYTKAIESYQAALEIQREIKDRMGEGVTTSSIALVYSSLGRRPKALELYAQALAIAREIHNRDDEAAILGGIGGLYNDNGEYEKGIKYTEQSLAIERELNKRREMGTSLNNLGASYFGLKQYDKALDYYKQALPIAREFKNRVDEAAILNNIAAIDYMLDRYNELIPILQQSLALQREIRNPVGEALCLKNFMSTWKAQDRPRLAIFYGKQAINAYQKIRASFSDLDKESQRSFLKSIEEGYRILANLLIGEGRLPEAQQVLGMLKEEEYFDFVRRDSKDAGVTSRTELTPEEAALEKRYNEIADRVTLIGKERGELLAKAARTADEDKRLASLDADIAVAGQAFEKFLTSLADELSGADQPGGKVFQLRESQGLMQDLRELGGGAVALYTIVGEDKYRIILTTPDAQKAVEYPISAADLNRKILAFRETLQNPRLDPLPLAQELYKIIVGPVAKDLKDAGAETLMWSLDGALRYVPITALHDGEKYMVERYRNVVFTPASQARLKDAPSANWKVLGLGVSKAKEGFDALPGAALELRGIIREDDATKAGVLPGTIKLDEAFTADALKTGLRQRFPLVHIASHFQFRPGNDADSFLLLGDGSHLTLGQIKSLPNIFGGVELLTLSACNTATGGAGASGKEVEGFGVLAQRQGAKAVMATLWSVADESTSLLMQEFYRLREARPGTLKAEAIRQAQLALLYGKQKAVSTGTQRRAERENDEPGAANQPLFKQNPEAPYAHPYYWAPFILIGNWK